MKYLNIGCGFYYSSEKEWTNLDFVSTGAGVIAHNLLKGIPFENDSFDLVYHSHVLEHFSKEEGEKMITECFRVLKPGGIIRIVIPDLEVIVRNYLHSLEKGLVDLNDEICKANYDWMMLEMYDQSVRNSSGGNMEKYLYMDTLINESFVFERIGEEGRAIRNRYLTSKQHKTSSIDAKPVKSIRGNLITRMKKTVRNYLMSKLSIDEQAMKIGKFRMGGEIHQWMYDRYSLSTLLNNQGGKDIRIRDAFTSFVNNWANYNIDGKGVIVRKPDSLYVEAIK